MARDAIVGQSPMRRIKYVKVTADLVLELLKVPKEGTVINGKMLKCIKNAIPDTAKVVRCGLDERGDIALVIEDQSFVPVIPGQHLYQLEPVYQLGDV